MGHKFDSDCGCILCGFDAAEWDYLRKQTHPDDRDETLQKEPICPNNPDGPNEYPPVDYRHEYDDDDQEYAMGDPDEYMDFDEDGNYVFI